MSTAYRACYWTDGRGEVCLTGPEVAHLPDDELEGVEWEGMPDEWKEWAARSLERQRCIRNEREGAVRDRRLESGQWKRRVKAGQEVSDG